VLVPAKANYPARFFPPIDSATRAPGCVDLRWCGVIRGDDAAFVDGSDSLRAQLAELVAAMARIESMRQPQPVMAVPTKRGGLHCDRRYGWCRSLSRCAGGGASARCRHDRCVRISAGDAGTQAVLSLRMRLGEIASGLQFVPEFAVGVGGDGTSVLALANVQYAFQSFGGSTAIRPYVTGGAGIFSPKVLAVNIAVGASMDLRHGRERRRWATSNCRASIFRDTR
jgi:hypothetical protein